MSFKIIGRWLTEYAMIMLNRLKLRVSAKSTQTCIRENRFGQAFINIHYVDHSIQALHSMHCRKVGKTWPKSLIFCNKMRPQQQSDRCNCNRTLNVIANWHVNSAKITHKNIDVFCLFIIIFDKRVEITMYTHYMSPWRGKNLNWRE